MCAAIGHPVTVLKRLAYGRIWLDPKLAPGRVRPLRDRELLLLRQQADLAPESDRPPAEHPGPNPDGNIYG
jgi:16S rRNA U516 pseudouridylate synthase RsuA-like enzyme